jgi:hypothetical protein
MAYQTCLVGVGHQIGSATLRTNGGIPIVHTARRLVSMAINVSGPAGPDLPVAPLTGCQGPADCRPVD